MDIYKEGFFIHEYGEFKTANLIFEIKDPLARGRINRIMMSIVSIHEDYNFNLTSFKDIMEFFVGEFKHIPNLYKGFYYDSIQDAAEPFHEIKESMYSFHQSLDIYKQNMSKITAYSLSPIGKSNIITYLQEKFSQSRQPIREITLNQTHKNL